MGLTGFNRARRDAEAAQAEQAGADAEERAKADAEAAQAEQARKPKSKAKDSPQ